MAIWVGHQLRLPDCSFWSRRIGTFARRLFASTGYLAKHKKIQEPEQLSEHQCIRLIYKEPLSQWDLRRGREHRRVTVSGTATANSVGMLARFSKEGMGIALLPDFLAFHPGFGEASAKGVPVSVRLFARNRERSISSPITRAPMWESQTPFRPHPHATSTMGLPCAVLTICTPYFRTEADGASRRMCSLQSAVNLWSWFLDFRTGTGISMSGGRQSGGG